MRKISLDITKVSTKNVKFNLILESEEDVKWKSKLIGRFSYNGNDYIKITPRPYITLDISPSYGKEEEWNRNHNVNLTRNGLFKFVNAMKEMIHAYKAEKDLYYYDSNNNLVMNKRLSDSIMTRLVISNKVIICQPSVIIDKVDGQQYEGMLLIINSIDNFCEFTYEEMEYLYYILMKVDFDTLTLQLISLAYKITNNTEVMNFKPKEKVVTKPNEEYLDKPIPKVEKNTIPDL